MRRRDFISLLSSAAVAWPHVVMAQSAAKRPLVAALLAASWATAARYVSNFREGLKELGYVEGRNANARACHELIRPLPDVFVTGSIAGIRALKQARAKIRRR
jgi:putative ABC transport system substrate-binding protein